MNNPGLPPRRGAHRARRSAVGVVLPSLLAVLGVLVVVAGLYLTLGNEGSSSAAMPVSTPVTSVRATTSAATTQPPATATPTVSPSSPAPAPASGTTEPATPSISPGTTTAAPSSPEPADRPQVSVLNETRRPGLASSTAAKLRRAGWDVVAVGNFRGNVATTTVYYPAGHEVAARALAADVGTDRIRPTFAGLPAGRLTVILTESYQG